MLLSMRQLKVRDMVDGFPDDEKSLDVLIEAVDLALGAAVSHLQEKYPMLQFEVIDPY